MNEEMEQLFYELKQYLPQHSYKWNILVDIEQLLIDLQKENQQLKERDLIIAIELEKLQNNWNELKEWLKSLQKYYISMKDKYDYSDEYKYAKDVLSKMQELEGGVDNDE